jgi:hypothetical protein
MSAVSSCRLAIVAAGSLLLLGLLVAEVDGARKRARPRARPARRGGGGAPPATARQSPGKAPSPQSAQAGQRPACSRPRQTAPAQSSPPSRPRSSRPSAPARRSPRPRTRTPGCRRATPAWCNSPAPWRQSPPSRSSCNRSPTTWPTPSRPASVGGCPSGLWAHRPGGDSDPSGRTTLHAGESTRPGVFSGLSPAGSAVRAALRSHHTDPHARLPVGCSCLESGLRGRYSDAELSACFPTRHDHGRCPG